MKKKIGKYAINVRENRLAKKTLNFLITERCFLNKKTAYVQNVR